MLEARHSAASASSASSETPARLALRAERAVHRARVDVGVAELGRQRAAGGRLAGARGAVDRDDESVASHGWLPMAHGVERLEESRVLLGRADRDAQPAAHVVGVERAHDHSARQQPPEQLAAVLARVVGDEVREARQHREAPCRQRPRRPAPSRARFSSTERRTCSWSESAAAAAACATEFVPNASRIGEQRVQHLGRGHRVAGPQPAEAVDLREGAGDDQRRAAQHQLDPVRVVRVVGVLEVRLVEHEQAAATAAPATSASSSARRFQVPVGLFGFATNTSRVRSSTALAIAERSWVQSRIGTRRAPWLWAETIWRKRTNACSEITALSPGPSSARAIRSMISTEPLPASRCETGTPRCAESAARSSVACGSG